MKFLKLILKILLGSIIFLVLAFFVLKMIYSKDLPIGVKGPEAERMAQSMLEAVNFAAWDTLPYVQWSFRDAHDFVLDKTNNTCRVSWGDCVVHLRMNDVDGIAYCKGEKLSGDKKHKLIKKAWSHWCNDSFWFNAPAKVFDPGTERSIVTNEDDSKSLLVTYVSGGVTPGDSYLWNFDESGMPTGWRMWTKIIPIGGVYTSWEGWTTLPNGAKISSLHKNGKLALKITNIKGGQTWQELGFGENPIEL